MATAPQISLRDNSGYTTNLVFSTNQATITLTGTITTNTAAIQISINGGPWVSDPTLVQIVLNTFTIPNPNNYPTGFLLNFGINTIQLRTIDIVGAVSATSTATITRVPDTLVTGAQIPTGIRVERNMNTATIFASLPPTTGVLATNVPGNNLTFLGFNFYASTVQGGSSGYFQVNNNPVTSASTETTQDIFQTQPFVALWDNSYRQNLRVRITEEDEFGNVLAERLNQLVNISSYIDSSMFNATFQSYQTNTFAYFEHNRSGGTNTINSDQFTAVANSSPLYYVVTALYFDSSINTEVETPYSQEVLGQPLVIDTNILDLPGRTQIQVVTDYITSIVAVNTDITLIPGSTTRDVSIDPFSSEAERIWFLVDFVHRSQSFLTLLQIDNVSGSGISDPVATSTYKTALEAALGYSSDTATQSLVDSQFDKLANNAGTTRLPGTAATGQVVFYTTTQPTVDLIIPAGTTVASTADLTTGTAAWVFSIGGSYIIPAATSSAFYNYTTRQYEITADVVATTIGSAGNLPAGTITNVLGLSNVSVVNRSSTVFGSDIESNADLAARAMLAYVSVDTGTEGGYEYTAASTIGVVKALVVKSGDALMMRDYDPVRMKHIGGKVDIWVQGVNERQVSETFAFSFEVATDIQCQIINLTTLTLEVLDSRVTPTSPITQILNNPSLNQGVFNVTTGQSYDLTGVIIVNYNTFQLNTSIPQPTTHIDDIITVDYRFESVDDFVFTFQPVRRVVSVVGEISGTLDPTNNYFLYTPDDPLLLGESTIAQNYLQVVQYQGVPSGNQITVNNEIHVLIGSVQEPLLSIGINLATVVVYNEARTITYNGPTTAEPDYEIITGTPTTPSLIVRSTESHIANGQTISVDYVHDENFTVTYVINDLLQQLQQVVNNKRHVTADVVVKQAIENDLVIETTVELNTGATSSNVDPAIRSAVSLVLDQKLIGQGVAQSNVTAAINNTTGVDFLVQPMANMAYADGSLKLREAIQASYLHLPSLDIGGNQVYICTDALSNPTVDNGGTAQVPRGVYQDDQVMVQAPHLTQVGSVAYSGFIIGSEGALINGYTDTATLVAAGFTTAATQQAELLVRTANHVVVSVLYTDNPSNHAYTCTYNVFGATGSQDITTAAVEYIILGPFTISYGS